MTAAVFLQLDDFLPNDELTTLAEFVRANQSALATSSINPAGEHELEVDDDYRRSRVLYELDPVTETFEPRLRALLPHVRTELGSGWFALDRIETQLTAHGDGDFFAVHTDSGGPEVASRMVTFVYYFALRPGAFSGGELRLYDNVERDGFYHPAATFTDIDPRSNSIVFFPSTLFHEVLPVRTDGDDLDDHRFTVNGWFHTGPPEPEHPALPADTATGGGPGRTSVRDS